MRFHMCDDYEMKKHRHFKWSPDEDADLIKIISGMKNINWESVAKKMGNRNVRQCKERWFYYLCPDVNNGEWSEDEDKLLMEKVAEFGTKWQKIAKFFTGRTNTNCKNRYLAMQREKSKRGKSNHQAPKPLKREITIETDHSTKLDDLNEEFFTNLFLPVDQLNWDIFSEIPSIDLL